MNVKEYFKLTDPMERVQQLTEEAIKNMGGRTEEPMSWEKCRGCEFLTNTSTSHTVEYYCKITREILTLSECVKGAGQ